MAESVTPRNRHEMKSLTSTQRRYAERIARAFRIPPRVIISGWAGGPWKRNKRRYGR